MTNNKDHLDPRGLFVDAYSIEGISEPECRGIFLDWALGVPHDEDSKANLAQLVARYAPLYPDHPMTEILRQGLESAPTPRRRRNRRGA